MNTLYNAYAQIINTVRTPERASPMMELVALCIDNDYEPMLDRLDDDLADDLCDYVFVVEGHVFDAVRAFLSSLGLSARSDMMFRRPKDSLRLLKAVLLDIEEFEDYGTLQAIALSGEPPSLMLESMLQYMHGDSTIQIVDMIDNVEPRLVNIITNYLTARVIADEKTGFDYAAANRLARYIRTYPDNPSIWAFSNMSPEADLKTVADSLDFPEEMSESRLLEIYTVGLAMANADKEEDALARLEVCLSMINSHELPTADILEKAKETIGTIYLQVRYRDSEENDE